MAKNTPPMAEPTNPPIRLLAPIMPIPVARDDPATSVAKVMNTGQPILRTTTAPNAIATVAQIAGSKANNIYAAAPPVSAEPAANPSRFR